MRQALIGTAVLAGYLSLTGWAHARPPQRVDTKVGNSFQTEVVREAQNDLSAGAGQVDRIKINYSDEKNLFAGAKKIHAYVGVATLKPDQTRTTGGTESMKGHNITLTLNKNGQYVGRLRVKLATNGGARAESITKITHAFSDLSKTNWDSKGIIGDDYEVPLDNK
jgi:hypothetical protein